MFQSEAILTGAQDVVVDVVVAKAAVTETAEHPRRTSNSLMYSTLTVRRSIWTLFSKPSARDICTSKAMALTVPWWL
jgi:hypothetical protein